MLGFAGSAIAAVLLVIVSLISYQFNDLRTVISLDMFMDVLDTLYSGLLWGGLLLALLRYRLYDADVVITRSAVWVAATPAIAFIFAALVEVLKQFAGPLFGNDFLLTPIAGVVTAMSIQPIAKWTERTIEAWSRRDLLALKKDLPAAVRDLREIDDRDRLLAYVCGTVRPAMRAQGVAIVVYEGEGLILGHKVGNTDDEINVWLSQSDLAPNRVDIDIDRGDTLFPIRIPLTARPMGDNQTIAWLLLGPRPDGSIQDKDARDTLVEAAPEIGHALHVISARRERNQAIVAGLTDQIIAIAT